MIVPYEKLSPEALRGLIEEFVTRDGTDSGYVGKTIEQNIVLVNKQLEKGEAFIVYDAKENTCNIVTMEHAEKLKMSRSKK